VRILIADAGHESRKLARQLLREDGWKLQIVKGRQRAFKITGLTWIVQRSFAWLQSSVQQGLRVPGAVVRALLDIAATRLILNRWHQHETAHQRQLGVV
jgi:hypothetical protein